MARTDYNQDVTDRLLLSGGLTFYLAKDLTFKSTVSMDRRWVHSSSFLDPIRTSYGRTQHGTASDTRSDDMRMIYDNILTWNKSFDRHSLEVMAGTSATTSVWEQLSGSRSYFSSTNNNAIPNLNGGNNGGVRGQSYGKSEWSIMSYLARVLYNYDSKYLVTANFRADGSSKLAPGHRWGYFPSFSAAWRISGEKFLRDVSWINDLKLRAGWGQTGNQAGLAEYGWMQQYSTNYYDWTLTENAQAVPTVGGRSNIKNEDLTWETSSQTNVGLDFALLNNRLSLSLDYYYKYTKDMLMSVPLPSPYPNITRNDGEMSNQGFEITLSSVNIARKGFRTGRPTRTFPAQPQQGRKTQPEAGILLRHDLRRDQRQRRAHDPGPPAFDVLGLCLQGGRSRDGRPGLRGPQRRRRDHAAGQDLDRQRQSQVHLRHDQQLLVEGA